MVTVKASRHTLMDAKIPSSDDMRHCPPFLSWTILSRPQEMLIGLNLEHVGLTFVVASTRFGLLVRLLLLPRLLLDGLLQRPSRFPHACSCSCSDADPARPVSGTEETVTARWTVSGLFRCDECGRGSDCESAPAAAAAGCGCRAFDSCGPARGLVVRKRANGAGVVVTMRNY